MVTALFHMVCSPAALEGAPAGWATSILQDGDLALLADEGGLPAIDAVAHELDLVCVAVIRPEATPERQGETVMAYAGSLPLVWVGGGFSETVRGWAVQRGAMTLLIDVDGPIPADQRGRIARFLAILTRQSE